MRTLVAPASRRLWTPPRRKIRWCPVHRRIVNMAAGDDLLVGDGDDALDANGDDLLSNGAGDACCCDNCPVTCTACTGSSNCAPNNFDVTFAGVEMATSCTPYPAGSPTDSAKIISGALDGTWTLSSAGNCTWRYYSASSPITGSIWFNTDCTSPNTTDDEMEIFLHVNGAFSHLCVWVRAAAVFSLFRKFYFSMTNCLVAQAAVSNDHLSTETFGTGVSAGCGFISSSSGAVFYTMGRGGTATITPA